MGGWLPAARVGLGASAGVVDCVTSAASTAEKIIESPEKGQRWPVFGVEKASIGLAKTGEAPKRHAKWDTPPTATAKGPQGPTPHLVVRPVARAVLFQFRKNLLLGLRPEKPRTQRKALV